MTWDGITEPPDRLKYLIGWYYDEHETALVGEPSLTKTIVHKRSFDWKKNENSVVFTTVRYPENRKFGYPVCHEIHQTWEFNVKSLKFTFLSEVTL
jgi:hypothetical protein